MSRKSPVDLATRKRESVRKAHAKRIDEGKRRVNFWLSAQAIETIDRLSEAYGRDRSQTLDDLLNGHIQISGQTDLFGFTDR